MKQDKNKLYNLTVEEAYKLLCSKDMANNRCNIQIYKQTPGNPGGGRKSGSKNKISLKSLKLDIDKLAKIVQDGFNQVNARIDKMETRIDNLVIKNKLKE